MKFDKVSPPIPTLNIKAFNQLHFSKKHWILEEGSINPEQFLVQRLEDTVSSIKLPIPPHRKTVFDFILVKEGEARRTFGLTEYDLKANQIFLMPTNQITSTPLISADIKGFYCHFTLDFLEGLLPFFEKLNLFENNHVVLNLTEDASNALSSKLEDLLVSTSSNFKHLTTQVALKLMTILFEIDSYFPETQEPRMLSAPERITESFKKLLNERIGSIKKVSDFSDLLHITPNHLNKSVRTVTGKSANQWILEMLLLESKTLLIQSNISISEIADALNFEDPGYFSRFFKASTGISPMAYRKKYNSL